MVRNEAAFNISWEKAVSITSLQVAVAIPSEEQWHIRCVCARASKSLQEWFCHAVISVSAPLMRAGFSFCPSPLGTRMEHWDKTVRNQCLWKDLYGHQENLLKAMTILYQWRYQISLHIQSLFATCKLDFILTPSQSNRCIYCWAPLQDTSKTRISCLHQFNLLHGQELRIMI